MGNTKSSSSSSSTGYTPGNDINPVEISLAMMAVARKVFLQRAHILALRNAMSKFSDVFGMIKREGFDQALALADLSKIEIFDLLFTMWDNAGDDKVSSKEFCTGISPLACPFDDIPSIIGFALRVGDDLNRGYIERHELHELLIGINSTASYFGDFYLLPKDIEGIVEAMFKKGEIETTHKDCVRRLSTNPYVKRFASGKARLRVQFKEGLVTEYIYDKEDLMTEYVVNNIDDLLAGTFSEKERILESGELRDDSVPTEQYDPPTSVAITALLDESKSRESAGSCRSPTSNSRDPPCTGSDPPSRRSYSTYQRSSSSSISRDPPAIINE